MPGTLSDLLEPSAADVVQQAMTEATAGMGVANTFEAYRDDPVGFGEDHFGESYTDDMAAVFESVRDNPVTIALTGNAVGKTHGAARLATWLYKCFPGAQVYTAAAPPKKNLETLLWGEINGLVQDHPDVFEADEVTSLNIQRSAKEFITGVTIPASGTAAEREARFSGKHAPVLAFFFDEGDGVPKEVYRGAESCMSGGWVRMLIMLNPRAPQGPVYDMIDRGEANVVRVSAFTQPNVVEGRDVIPGAVTRDTTVRRINAWTRPLAPGETPTEDDFEVPAFLVGTTAQRKSGGTYPPLPAGWRRVTEQAFFYMVLARFPSQGTRQLISRDAISRARARWDAYVAEHGERAPVGADAIAGLDVAEYGDDANCLTIRAGGWVARPERWKGVNPDDTAEIAAPKVTGCLRAHVDTIGIGAGVPRRMTKELRTARSRTIAHGVKVSKKPTRSAVSREGTPLGDFERLRDQLAWEVREWLEQDAGAMLPPDEQLVEELRALTYEVTPKGKIKLIQKTVLREVLGRSPDAFDSLALTFAPEPVRLGGGLVGRRGQ
ncbi:MAG: hypothetical protein AAFP15_14725 [Bacteroidota bacterium]